MDEQKQNDVMQKFNELFNTKQSLYTRLKYNIEFKLLDIKYWLMYKFEIRRSRHILRLKLHGFKPIMFTELMMEDTFIFETEEEANRAYNKFEYDKNGKYIGKIAGWWYSIDDFNRQSSENKEWNAGINDRFWIKKGYGLDISEGYVKIIGVGSNDSSFFVRLTNAKL